MHYLDALCMYALAKTVSNCHIKYNFKYVFYLKFSVQLLSKSSFRSLSPKFGYTLLLALLIVIHTLYYRINHGYTIDLWHYSSCTILLKGEFNASCMYRNKM